MRKFINIVEKAGQANIDTPEFKAWFGESKVVDATGNPLRVFHGGAADIKAFDKNYIGKTFGADKEGFFFTTNTYYSTAWFGGDDYRVYDDMYSAGAYAKNVEGAVYPCYLRIENPLYLRDWVNSVELDYEYEVANYGHTQDVLDRYKRDIVAAAREGDHDGIIASHGNDQVFVVFEPNQIKSVFNTEFDPTSDNISEDLDPALRAAVWAASEKHLRYSPPTFVKSSGADEWFGTEDAAKIAEIVNNDLQKLFSKGSAKIWRIINVPDEVIRGLKAGDSLGPLDPEKPASWTTNWQDIQFDALEIYNLHDELDNYFVIEAEVPLDAVDVPLTIAQNIALHWEREITLKRGQSIRLVSIRRAEQYGGTTEDMRPDLHGVMMRS